MPLSRPIAVLLALAGLACVSHDEVARVRSPTGAVDAVLFETNGGATTSFGYDVYLAQAGQPAARGRMVATLYGAARSQQAYGVNLVWDDARHLTIQYLEARQDTLLKDSVQFAGQAVLVKLQSGVLDSTAPPGGMLYNLRGRPE